MFERFEQRRRRWPALNYRKATNYVSCLLDNVCHWLEDGSMLTTDSVQAYHEAAHAALLNAREIGMCLCGDSHCHVYTFTEGRKLSSPRHFKMRNGLCRLLFSTKKMLPCHS